MVNVFIYIAFVHIRCWQGDNFKTIQLELTVKPLLSTKMENTCEKVTCVSLQNVCDSWSRDHITRKIDDWLTYLPEKVPTKAAGGYVIIWSLHLLHRNFDVIYRCGKSKTDHRKTV